jgi:choline kinase
MSSEKHQKLSAVLLAAGVGRRLGQAEPSPKVLLDFGGRNLLQRHIDALAEVGIDELVIVTGFEAGQIEAAVRALAPPFAIRLVRNPRFTEGSVVSLAAAGETLRSGASVILMDGDVLYDTRVLARLREAPGENVLLVDQEFEVGDEPVKLCFDEAGRICDFRKLPQNPGVWRGESVGFFRFSPAMAARLAERCDHYVAAAPRSEYEEAIRDLMLGQPDRFDAVDVTDLAWTEIDFEEDVVKAREVVLPQLEPLS